MGNSRRWRWSFGRRVALRPRPTNMRPRPRLPLNMIGWGILMLGSCDLVCVMGNKLGAVGL